MLKVGLTGGIGSGKTTVAKIFESFGVPVYYSDDRAKFLMNSSQVIRNALIELFGEDAYIDQGINRPYIASVVFSDKKKLQQLNNIVHPVVGEDFEKWIKEQHSPFVLKEAAILIESGAYKSVDKIVVVSAPEDVRIERVKARDGVEERQVRDRMKNQLSEEERIKLADFVIYNDGEQMLIPQVEHTISVLKKILLNKKAFN